MNTHYLIDKTYHENKKLLSKNLSVNEFKCKCTHEDCTFTMIDSRVVVAFQKLRGFLGRPLHVTSGFRCQKHNSDVGGAKDSRHKRGQAIDLTWDLDIEDLAFHAKGFFDKVILYKDKNFIHCHME